MQVTGQD